jgi:glycosyltransferase involved in cell wall biosynthesis
VTVLTATRGEDLESLRVVRVPASNALRRFNVPYPVPEPVSLLRELRRLIAWADVVNPQDALYATTLAALTTSRAMKRPSVLTQHVAFVPQQSRMLDLAQRAAIETIGRCSRLATRVVAYNPAVADWVGRTWGVGDVLVVPPGVPDSPLVARDAVRREFGIPTDRFVALFAGRDVPKKGLDVFLSARDPAYELVAVTDRAQVEDGAQILPFVEPQRFRELLASVDAFVLPSQGEGFPLALQEALVTGLPCVVTSGPGYEHYLRDGEAIFVRPDSSEIRQAVKRLAMDEPTRRKFATRAREAGRREFGVGRFIEQYEGLYDEACTLLR